MESIEGGLDGGAAATSTLLDGLCRTRRNTVHDMEIVSEYSLEVDPDDVVGMKVSDAPGSPDAPSKTDVELRRVWMIIQDDEIPFGYDFKIEARERRPTSNRSLFVPVGSPSLQQKSVNFLNYSSVGNRGMDGRAPIWHDKVHICHEVASTKSSS